MHHKSAEHKKKLPIHYFPLFFLKKKTMPFALLFHHQKKFHPHLTPLSLFLPLHFSLSFCNVGENSNDSTATRTECSFYPSHALFPLQKHQIGTSFVSLSDSFFFPVCSIGSHQILVTLPLCPFESSINEDANYEA